MISAKTEELPIYLFHQGTNYRAFDFLGVHLDTVKGKKGAWFRTWAPAAKSVAVVGDFNKWDESANKMTRVNKQGVFEIFINGVSQFDNYKFAVEHKDGVIVLKADPYAFHAETPSGTASKIYDLDGYNWNDSEFVKNRCTVYDKPVNIYEVNLASWKKHKDGSYYTYRELAKELVDYAVEMGYTHLEFMPVSEYPFDGSWGYQVTGYYAITSRFGTPKDFMFLIDECHKKGLSVILDWVPAHFPKDEHGLYEFDGTPCYEYASKNKQEHKSWGTRIFDWGKNEVQSFLVSNAVMLFDKFHIDGLRVDAVASMLYLDYDRKPGEWSPNAEGGNYNLEAIAFFRKLNSIIFSSYPYAMMIAEESTAFPLITKPADIGGLGFNFKWNMGWMNDSLSYMQTDPYFRSGNHKKLTFSMYYAFSENYILPISHDEVVHGKKSLIEKMQGSYEEKFDNLRAYMTYIFSHPGKKLSFMGNEFGQFKEWNYKEGLEFFMLDFVKHKELRDFNKCLNALYKNTPAFYEIEDSWDGFEWISADEKDNNLISYIRRDKCGGEIIVVINFSGRTLEKYRLGLKEGKYKVLLCSSDKQFGGSGELKTKSFKTVKKAAHGKNSSILLNIPKFTGLYLKKI